MKDYNLLSRVINGAKNDDISVYSSFTKESDKKTKFKDNNNSPTSYNNKNICYFSPQKTSSFKENIDNKNLDFINKYLNTVSSTNSKPIIRQDKESKDKSCSYSIFEKIESYNNEKPNKSNKSNFELVSLLLY